MVWYFVILLTVTAIAWLCSDTRPVCIPGIPRLDIRTVSITCLVIIGIILVAFMGLRASSVGTDTGGYCRNFMRGGGWWLIDTSSWKVIFEEPGLYIVYILADIFSRNYISFLTISAAVIVPCALLSIRQSSVNETASIFTYVSLAYYLFGFAGIRQAMAMSVYMLSFRYIIDGKFWKYALVVLIAALFHKSIIVALPAYLVTLLRFSVRNISLLAVGGMCIGLLLPLLLSFGSSLEERYVYFLMSTAAGSGQMLALFSVVITVFYIYVRRDIVPAMLGSYDKMLFLLTISSSIYLIVSLTGSNTELNRFALYFQPATIFLFAMYFQSVRENDNKLLLYGMIAMQILYFGVYCYKIGGIRDYVLNPIL